MTVLGSVALHAQTYKVLYAFTGGADGQTPESGLTMDSAGNLYGTTDFGGRVEGHCINFGGCGIVFKLSKAGSDWLFANLYAFRGTGADGIKPTSRVVFGPDGGLYGTTDFGGIVPANSYGPSYGTVYRLSTPSGTCKDPSCPWIDTVLYRFTGGADGSLPLSADLIFDKAGNLYGTTPYGGINGNFALDVGLCSS